MFLNIKCQSQFVKKLQDSLKQIYTRKSVLHVYMIFHTKKEAILLPGEYPEN